MRSTAKENKKAPEYQNGAQGLLFNLSEILTGYSQFSSGVPRFSFHKLRHYYASSLHALGVPDKYIMASGGWESEQTLNAVYKHAMSATQQRENQRAVEHFASTLCNTKCNTDSKGTA